MEVRPFDFVNSIISESVCGETINLAPARYAFSAVPGFSTVPAPIITSSSFESSSMISNDPFLIVITSRSLIPPSIHAWGKSSASFIHQI